MLIISSQPPQKKQRRQKCDLRFSHAWCSGNCFCRRLPWRQFLVQ